MKIVVHNSRSFAVVAIAALLLSGSLWGQGMTKGIMAPPSNVKPIGLKHVGIEQHLGEQKIDKDDEDRSPNDGLNR